MSNDRPKTIGIFNSGKDNTFIDVTTEGFDVGIKDEGSGSHYHRIRNILRRTEVAVLPWFQRPLGLILLGVITIIAASGLAHTFGWP